ncbi:surfeit locus protein 6 homolog [Artemia franciscana]|uniref:Ribosomal RNA-processing protein 14/surfeit locus protein 6 C-terminal domain-containing protein n=1 Tax=Artemia franciscana TaxID=6661 RepID=A0AA88LES9_ARTSF|nr:hypothetical protein QYM36_002266 [Artemia franciscana]KAK2723855.1 hypothetical protein QYM36_002266 [Artemia franciscana]
MKVNSKQKHASSRNDSAGWQDLDVKPNIEDLCIKTAQIQKGTLEFNKIEFGRQTEDEKAKFKKKRKLSRDPFKALSKLEETKDRIKRLEEQGKLHIAESIVNRRAWQAALLKSEGLKVKDNIDLVRKSVKRKLNQKEKSRKNWQQRIKAQEHAKETKQKKRRENIKKKKDQKKQKQLKKLVKKGRYVKGVI